MTIQTDSLKTQARMYAWRILLDTLKPEIENGCDGHPAWDEMLDDRDLFEATEGQITAIYHELQRRAKRERP